MHDIVLFGLKLIIPFFFFHQREMETAAHNIRLKQPAGPCEAGALLFRKEKKVVFTQSCGSHPVLENCRFIFLDTGSKYKEDNASSIHFLQEKHEPYNFNSSGLRGRTGFEVQGRRNSAGPALSTLYPGANPN